MSLIYEVLIISIMLFFNAVFAAYEMALAAISHSRISALINEKKKGASDVLFMKERMEISLTVVQLGITVSGAFAAATGGAGMKEAFVPYLETQWGLSAGFSDALAIIFLIIPLSFITIVFAELIPKLFALNNREWVVLKFSPLMKLLSLAAYPVVSVFEKLVKRLIRIGESKWKPDAGTKPKHRLQELIDAASLARTSRLLGAREEKIVLAAAHLATQPVSSIIIPAADISMIPLESALSDALIKAHMDMHTRFPVCSKEGDSQTISGYVNFKDIVTALRVNPSNPTIRGITRTIKKVSADMPQSQLLEQMIQEKIHIALVMKGENEVMGLVTLEDIIEELVGEIEDEFDRLPTHINFAGSYWIVGGGVVMREVGSVLGIDWLNDDDENSRLTLADWCVKQTKGKLKGGQSIQIENLSVTPRKFRRKRLSEAMIINTTDLGNAS